MSARSAAPRPVPSKLLDLSMTFPLKLAIFSRRKSLLERLPSALITSTSTPASSLTSSIISETIIAMDSSAALTMCSFFTPLVRPIIRPVALGSL